MEPPISPARRGRRPTAVEETLDRLARLHPKKIDLSLDRISRLLAALGDPQDRLPAVVHIAGTNGKGSVAAYVRAMAEAAGLKAHAYASPHLVRFNERIILAGEEIGDDALAALLTRVEDVNDGAPITFFEITTAAAFLAFAETPGDVAVIEVGLGGRFDATNVVAAPACSVITPVSIDHVEFLGDDLTGIAHEKAGVLKPGVPAVIGPQEPAARAAIVTAALEVGAQPIVWGADFSARREGDRLTFEARDRVLDLPPPALAGEHQIGNAGVAIAAALTLDAIPDPAIAAGLENVRWAGRLQKVGPGPLFATAHPDGEGEVWVDGAHNIHAAQALARAVADLDDLDPRPLVLIVAMQSTKDVRGFFAAFNGLARSAICIPLTTTASGVPPGDLARAARGEGVDADAAGGLPQALAAVRDWRAEDEPAPRVVICGSLYLAGEALAFDMGRARSATAG